ncbi:GTPase-activating protein [Starmerella bacillaris]|uniref:Rab proteins geranylgeranyltransferase n=1 Tax=Starmerella bacillaris TaxID=1247836 RepID=A0AAV5RJK8_STABA|nr:GTPase-activating protein [Starmerella bacillaris]
MSSYSAREATRRGSVVPPLAGVDRPVIDTVPSKCDVLICGTGLAESILAAALAWQGTNVLHIDAHNVYGDSNMCLSSKDLTTWIETVANGSEPTGMNAQFYVSAPGNSSSRAQRFLFDMSPHVMFVKSDMLDLLIKSRVAKYLDFKGLSQFHTYESDSFEKVTGNKEQIFTDQSLSLKTKRKLMKFIKFVLEWTIEENEFRALSNIPISLYLEKEFELEKAQIVELVIAIGLCDHLDVSASYALPKIRRYLLSLDVYGSFPAMYSMYGSSGELAQGFCRSAAVAGATYKLGVQLTGWDEQSNIATLSDGSKVQVAEKAFLSPTQPSPLRPLVNVDQFADEDINQNVPQGDGSGDLGSKNKNANTIYNSFDNLQRLKGTKYAANPYSSAYRGITSRMVAVVTNECKEWFKDGESAAIVVFPPGSLSTNNEYAVQTIVYGPGAGIVPEGFSCWYLNTHNPDKQKARDDLNDALSKLESSILRESNLGHLIGSLSGEDIAYKHGAAVVSSVRLGESMQNFVPQKRLNYLFKLAYTSPTSKGRKFNKVELQPVLPGSDTLLSTLFAPGEISYDGIVSQARKLYESVVGSDDDFFDVDFEDDEETEALDPLEPIDPIDSMKDTVSGSPDHPAEEVMHMEL